MEMKKIACAVLVAAASATMAFAADAPAPAPSSSFAITPAVGAAVGASIRLNKGSRERRKELKSQEQLLERVLSQRCHLYDQEPVQGHHRQVLWWSRQQ
ncbi:hypothetical protein FCM35_KLT21936 [Carex littledalei]|uniref:Uncharacterized protein n=1 Tax=Carex littledalei TaxID=544730 RepID=A0A833QIA3_9POAL|nr:hypothetical protein FCM35_KLT21936 [Carex littledalei]